MENNSSGFADVEDSDDAEPATTAEELFEVIHIGGTEHRTVRAGMCVDCQKIPRRKRDMRCWECSVTALSQKHATSAV